MHSCFADMLGVARQRRTGREAQAQQRQAPNLAVRILLEAAVISSDVRHSDDGGLEDARVSQVIRELDPMIDHISYK